MQLRISQQVELIKEDIYEYFWNKDAKLIAHSYGGYLLLHTLTLMKPFPGKVLLILPVLGTSKVQKNALISRPPWADKLIKYAENLEFPPFNVEIHTGSNDCGSRPQNAQTIINAIDGGDLFIVENTGHSLDREYISVVFKNFLEIKKID